MFFFYILELSKARSPVGRLTHTMHINTSFTAVVFLSAVNPILSVPYLHLLVARDRQWIEEVAKNQLSWIMVISRKTIKVFFDTRMTFQVSGRGKNGLLIAICDDCHQIFSIYYVGAAPVGWNSFIVAAHRPWPVNKLHCLHSSTLCHVEGTILIIFGSKADGFFTIYLLPAL